MPRPDHYVAPSRIRFLRNQPGGEEGQDGKEKKSAQEIVKEKAAKRQKQVDDRTATRLAAREALAATEVAAAAKAAADPEWMYEDASQQLQGPFPLSSMQEWFAGGFLPLGTRVMRDAVGAELFELRHAPEIAGTKAEAEGEGAAQPTAAQWKSAGNVHMAAGRLAEAIAAYGSAL
jgi:hypothetical protein